MLLQAKDVVLEYKDGKNLNRAVKSVSIDFDFTGTYAILGPSGSGKSSLLYMLAGIRKPTKGEILYYGYPFPKSRAMRDKLRREEMGFVFQTHFLIKYLNVFENILVGANPSDLRHQDWINELSHILGLEEMLHKFPGELSGGQRQRVSLARALANKPKVIFVDEPTASLDHENGRKVVELLGRIATHACVIMVTHDESILINPRKVLHLWDGRLVEK
jgi:putative ABC transport system ATP-binding protein